MPEFQITYNHEPGNYLGPWSLLEGGFDNLEQAQDRAREIAALPESPNAKGGGIGIMVGEVGHVPVWACFGGGDEGYGKFVPSISLPPSPPQ